MIVTKDFGEVLIMRRRKVTPQMIKKMKALRKKGLSYGKIARELNLGTMTVYNYLKKEEKVGFFGRLKRKFGRG